MQVVIANPGYPDPLGFNPRGTRITNPTPSTTIAAFDTNVPHTATTSIGFSRQLVPDLAVSADYVHARGRDLLRSQDLNAPDPATRVRPNPSFVRVMAVGTNANSWYDALQLQVTKRFSRRYQFTTAYTFAKALRDTEDWSFSPSNQFDPAADKGPANSDVRHVLAVSSIVSFPFGFRTGIVGRARSALPYTITTGLDNNGDSFFTDRPAGIGRNSERAPAFFTVDFRISKFFTIRSVRIEGLAEAFNLLNRNPNIVYAGSYGGAITRMDTSTGLIDDIRVYPEDGNGRRAADLINRFRWNAPIRISPHDPDVLYHTSQYVHRTKDGGQNWETISPDLTRNDKSKEDYTAARAIIHGNGWGEVYGTIFAFEESPRTRGLLWAGSDDGLVHLSRDNGAAWTNITPREMPEQEAYRSGRGPASIYYYFPVAPKQPVTIDISDAKGNLVTRFTGVGGPDEGQPAARGAARRGARSSAGTQVAARAGLNRLAWDMRYAPLFELSGGSGPGGPAGAPPRVVPAVYQVKVSTGSWSQTQALEVKADPRLTISPAAYEDQLALARAVGASLKELYDRAASRDRCPTRGRRSPGPDIRRRHQRRGCRDFPRGCWRK